MIYYEHDEIQELTKNFSLGKAVALVCGLIVRQRKVIDETKVPFDKERFEYLGKCISDLVKIIDKQIEIRPEGGIHV